MQAEYNFLEKTIKDICGTDPVYYYANPGNLGDAVIRIGTLKFFQDKGITVTEITEKTPLVIPSLNQVVLLYGGGGAWCKFWNSANRFVSVSAKYFKHVIVLPSTYEMSPAIPRTTYFCRDFYNSKKNMPEALFCHDMAFYLGELGTSAAAGSGTGYFFRTDIESANAMEIPAENNDISMTGDHLASISGFVEGIARFSVIHTDRLHVAIVACLLGREMHLYPGAYFKNRDVYLSSIKERYRNVFFHDE